MGVGSRIYKLLQFGSLAVGPLGFNLRSTGKGKALADGSSEGPAFFLHQTVTQGPEWDGALK